MTDRYDEWMPRINALMDDILDTVEYEKLVEELQKIATYHGAATGRYDELLEQEEEERLEALCTEKGYHEWVIAGIAGELNAEELELCCDTCGQTRYMEVN